MYALKQLYVRLINVCSVKIFIYGFGLQFVILCKVHLCLSRTKLVQSGVVSWDASYCMWSGGATLDLSTKEQNNVQQSDQDLSNSRS